MKDNKKVVIIDYQLSNLFSVKHACEYVGLNALISSNPKDIINADAAILPGVGAFGDAMKNLENLGLTVPIHEFIKSGRQFLGICLGLQLLFSESYEFGNHKGLGIFKGKVVKFPTKNPENEKIRVPQIGWNQVYKSKQNSNWEKSPLKIINNFEFMYFVHSYFIIPENLEDILSMTNYGNIEYCSSVLRENVFAVQFHPEKSGKEGIKIYKEWKENI
jgi:imidazole glycerol-phosphate synthase subunit HisH